MVLSAKCAIPPPVLSAFNTPLSSMQSKNSLDGLDNKETQPPLPPKADRYNQLKSQLTSSEGKKHSLSRLFLSVIYNSITLSSPGCTVLQYPKLPLCTTSATVCELALVRMMNICSHGR